jgi:hypothetical protein
MESVETILKPVLNNAADGKGQRFSSPRWASRLSLERARTLSELFLETEPEWRLYEELQAADIRFKLVPGAPASLAQDESNWRTWFEFDDGARVRYSGLNGFRFESRSGDISMLPSPERIRDFIKSTMWQRS